MPELDGRQSPEEIAENIPQKKLRIIKSIKQGDGRGSTKLIRELTGYGATDSKHYRDQCVAEGLFENRGVGDGHNEGTLYELTQRGEAVLEIARERGPSENTEPTLADAMEYTSAVDDTVQGLEGDVDSLRDTVKTLREDGAEPEAIGEIEGRLKTLERRSEFWKQTAIVLAENEEYFDLGEIQDRVDDEFEETE